MDKNINKEDLEKKLNEDNNQDLKKETKSKEKHHDNKQVKLLEGKIEKLNSEIQSKDEKILRIQAELVNFKRRKEEETSYMLKYANEDIIKSLLPIVDNFERGLVMDDNDLSDEVSKFLSGFKMIYSDVINIFNDNEVKVIDALGIEFDPKVHQAVLVEKDENKPAGVVLEVLQKGYMYKDKVIRPAMVKVNQ